MQTELSMMRLETERLIIRPYIDSDLMESFELMQNPELFTYMHMGVLSFEEYKRNMRTEYSTNGGCRYESVAFAAFTGSNVEGTEVTKKYIALINKLTYTG